MNLILDTHVFLWWVEGSERLSKTALKIISDTKNTVHISAVVAWEIALKSQLGLLVITRSPREYIAEHVVKSGFVPLAISLSHASRISELPALHKDPFDRLLIAQALHENYTLVSSDEVIKKYKVKIIW